MVEDTKAALERIAYENYLYGLGTGLGLSRNEAEYGRMLRETTVEANRKNLEYGWRVGVSNAVHG